MLVVELFAASDSRNRAAGNGRPTLEDEMTHTPLTMLYDIWNGFEPAFKLFGACVASGIVWQLIGGAFWKGHRE